MTFLKRYLHQGSLCCREKLGIVDLLALTSLEQLLLITETLLTFFTKQVVLLRRSTVLSLPLQLVFPAYIY
jgi:hypothetical protein